MKEVNAIRVPTSWVCPEGKLQYNIFRLDGRLIYYLEDIFLARSVRMDAEATLGSRKDKENFVDYEFKDYKGIWTMLKISNQRLCARRNCTWLCCSTQPEHTRS